MPAPNIPETFSRLPRTAASESPGLGKAVSKSPGREAFTKKDEKPLSSIAPAASLLFPVSAPWFMRITNRKFGSRTAGPG